jgi:hypothetical protein
MRRVLAGALGIALLAAAVPLSAKRTPLLEVNFKTGSKRRIDAAGPQTAADRDLDAALGAAMGSSFSTQDLERIAEALGRYLGHLRLRASARLMLFLYPGSVTRAALRELREINVDVDLLVDPCGRAVCREAVGQHLELVGKALRQAELRTRSYTVRFASVTVRTVSDLRGSEQDQYRFSAEQVVRAGQVGSGTQLVRDVDAARAGYEKEMVRAISARLRAGRVQVDGAVEVQRARGAGTVRFAIRSDRVRYETHVTTALTATARALRASPITPSNTEVTVSALIAGRGQGRQDFRAGLHPLGLYVDGQLGLRDLWSTYVVTKQRGAKVLSFDDGEARGGSLDDGDDDDGEDNTPEILGAHFDALAPCLQAAAAQDKRFRGVTLLFSVAAGQARDLRLKERGASAALQGCLQRALSQIRFPRRGGPPRQVSYPMYIKR